MKVMVIPIVVGSLWGNPQRIVEGTGRLGNKRIEGTIQLQHH